VNHPKHIPSNTTFMLLISYSKTQHISFCMNASKKPATTHKELQ